MLELDVIRRRERVKVVSTAIEEDRSIAFLGDDKLHIDFVVLEVARDIHELQLDGFENLYLKASFILKAIVLRLFDLVSERPVNNMVKNSINSNLITIIRTARSHYIGDKVVVEIINMAQERGFLLELEKNIK